MVLKKIQLKNFRNYSDTEINFNEKFNFIYGDNGHGKTNILEAISITTFGKSFLGSAETDCVKFSNEDFFIESDFENDLGNKDVIIVNYNLQNKTKLIHKNKEKVTAFSSEIFGRYPLVFLSPKSLNITYGNPSDRRKFFDILISQASPLYLDNLKELAKILKQKNALLKNYSLHKQYSFGDFKNLLNSYNEKLSDVSAKIINKRINFLIGFEKFFIKNFSFLQPNGDSASISYESESLGIFGTADSKPDLNSIYEKIREFIYKKFDEEVSRMVSLAGPHRDDYIFMLDKINHNKKEIFNLKNFASQGEHKTFLIALKLSEYDYLKDKKSTSPILLLDDVLSELDENRVSKIISHLKDYGQIFLTTTSKDYLGNLNRFYNESEISAFKVNQGNIEQ